MLLTHSPWIIQQVPLPRCCVFVTWWKPMTFHMWTDSIRLHSISQITWEKLWEPQLRQVRTCRASDAWEVFFYRLTSNLSESQNVWNQASKSQVLRQSLFPNSFQCWQLGGLRAPNSLVERHLTITFAIFEGPGVPHRNTHNYLLQYQTNSKNKLNQCSWHKGMW